MLSISLLLHKVAAMTDFSDSTSYQLTTDPFASERGTYFETHPQSIPHDQRDEEDLDRFQEEILRLYNDHAPDDLEAGESTVGEPSEKQTAQWRSIITTALTCNSTLQRLMADERNSPGTHNFKDLRVSPNWLIGIYLPGFYHHFSSFNDGYDQVLKNIVHNPSLGSLEFARFLIDIQINSLDQIASGEATSDERGNDVERQPTYPTRDAISQLFLLCQDEKTLNHKRVIVADHLYDLEKLVEDIPAAKLLGQRYQEASIDDRDTLIDRFGKQALRCLPTWARSLEQTSMLDINVANDFTEQVQAAASIAEDVEGVQDEQEVGRGSSRNLPQTAVVEGISKDVATYDDPLHLQSLQATFDEKASKSTNRAFFYPNFKAPTINVLYFVKRPAQSLSQFDSQEGEPVPVSDAAKAAAAAAAGFKRARMISSKDELESADTVAAPEADKVLSDCKSYLNQLLNDGEYHKRGFDDIFKVLSEMTDRPEKAAKLEMGAEGFRGFSDLLMKDDWWHVRSFFKALIEMLSIGLNAKAKASTAGTIQQFELEIAVLLSMIGGGANDPLPWVLVVEHVLRILWKTVMHMPICGEDDRRSKIQIRLMFSELVVWVNATTVNAYVLRCKRRGTVATKVVVSVVILPLLHQRINVS